MRDFLVGVAAFIALFLGLLIAGPVLLIVAYVVAVPILAAVIVAAEVFGKWLVIGLMAGVSLGLCVLK